MCHFFIKVSKIDAYFSFFSRTMLCSLVRVNGLKRKLFEEKMETVITKLNHDLNSATAPRTGRLKSYSNLDSRIVSAVNNFTSGYPCWKFISVDLPLRMEQEVAIIRGGGQHAQSKLVFGLQS